MSCKKPLKNILWVGNTTEKGANMAKSNISNATVAKSSTPRLENWYPADMKGNPIPMEKPFKIDKKNPVALIGTVYGRPGFDDGQIISTSKVAKLEGHQAFTGSGSVYTLGEMHPDYKEMMDAKNHGIPVVGSWSLFHPNTHFKGCIGFWFSGFDADGNEVEGEIYSQDGNYLEIKSSDDKEPVKIFVIWKSFSLQTEGELRLCRSTMTGLRYEEFEEAFEFKCRPQF